MQSTRAPRGLGLKHAAVFKTAVTRRAAHVVRFKESGGSEAAAPANVLEARAWIAAWQQRSLSATKAMLEKTLTSDAPAEGAALASAEDAAAPPAAVVLPATEMAFVKVRFSLQHHLEPGTSIHVVGSLSELSQWCPRASPKMAWSAGDVWSVDVEFPAGPFAFKFVAVSDVDENAPVVWEDAPFVDRQIMVPEALAGVDGTLLLVESSAFGAYDTATRVATLAPGEPWAPVVTHALTAAISQIAEARAAAAAAEAAAEAAAALEAAAVPAELSPAEIDAAVAELEQLSAQLRATEAFALTPDLAAEAEAAAAAAAAAPVAMDLSQVSLQLGGGLSESDTGLVLAFATGSALVGGFLWEVLNPPM